MRASIHPNRLRCDYRENPLGVDRKPPPLSWQLKSDQVGASQTAYHILVSSTLSALAQDVGDYWDSGRLVSHQNVHVPYGGAALNSLTRAWWKVRVWDQAGAASGWSEPAFWETGIMDDRDWRSEWIQDLLIGGPRTTAPAPFMRKEIRIDAQILRARLVVTALGFYEFRINGAKVGDQFLTPGWSDYRRQVPYLVYDVTAMLKEGENALGAILADGWYCGNLEGLGRQVFGDRPKLRAQLHVGAGGRRPRIFTTDRTWRTTFGPILETDPLKGESYDARRDLGAWDQPGYDDSAWRLAEVASIQIECVGHRGPVVQAEPVTGPMHLPIEMPSGERREFLLEFEQDISGRVQIRAKGQAGSTFSLRYAESVIWKRPATAATRTIRPVDHYTLRGDPDGEEWAPAFAHHEFRYIAIEGLDQPPAADAVSAVALRFDAPPAASLACSDGRVNRLFEASSRADLAVRQGAVPRGRSIGLDALQWAFIRPWNEYLRTGDADFLRDGYEAMKELLERPEEQSRDLAKSDVLFACSIRLAAKVASLIGKPDDAERYELWCSAFRLSPAASGEPSGLDRQTSASLALYFDMLPGLARVNAIRYLVGDIDKGRLLVARGCGDYLLRVLSDNGHLEMAYRLLLDSANEFAFQTVGSWLTSVVAGIDVDESRPGYEHAVIRPRPGGGLRYARGTVHSIRGDITSHWRLAQGVFTLEAKIPAGATATAYIPCRPLVEVEATCGARYSRHTPDAAVYELPSGDFCFKSKC